jgi:uncharacterized protein
MFGRLLLWGVLALAAWWILRPRRPVAPPAAKHPAGPAGAPGTAVVVLEDMVDCARCGLHFPASEAVRDGARVFCCAAHRDADSSRAG